MLLGLNFRPFTALGIVAAHPPRSGPHPASSPHTKPLSCHIVAFESPPARLPDTPRACILIPLSHRGTGAGEGDSRSLVFQAGALTTLCALFIRSQPNSAPGAQRSAAACMRPGLSCFPDSRVPDSHFHFLDRLPNK